MNHECENKFFRNKLPTIYCGRESRDTSTNLQFLETIGQVFLDVGVGAREEPHSQVRQVFERVRLDKVQSG